MIQHEAKGLFMEEETKEDLSFFQELRKTATMLDSSLAEFKQKIKMYRVSDSTSRKTAMAKLREIQDEVLSMKDDFSKLQEKIESFNTFHEFLEDSEQELSNSEAQLTKIEEYLKKYGFVPQQKEKCDKKESPKKTPKEDVKEDDEEKEEKTQRASTPVLSDFNLSSYTLNYLAGKDEPKSAIKLPLQRANAQMSVKPTPTSTYQSASVEELLKDIQLRPPEDRTDLSPIHSAVKSAVKLPLQRANEQMSVKPTPTSKYQSARFRDIHRFGNTPLYKTLQNQLIEETPMIFRQNNTSSLNPMPTPLCLDEDKLTDTYGSLYTPIVNKANKKLFDDDAKANSKNDSFDFERLDSPVLKFQDADKPTSVTPEEPVMTTVKKSKSGKVFLTKNVHEMPASPVLHHPF